ncbi:uncharacterized protein LOC105388973 [Plutella xylostella]|uniref:uncharacterized protein LOC105388973 n=1 Tax=Plutella xylostella TaxID=51655 RepID=UPI002032EC31|nr:uncharacterized protein LOC105388973 [Plutella xylostella]
MLKKIFTIVLISALFVQNISAGDDATTEAATTAKPDETTTPKVTTPQVTTPEVTTPKVTTPKTTPDSGKGLVSTWMQGGKKMVDDMDKVAEDTANKWLALWG